MKLMLEPRIVAASTHGRADFAHGAEPGAASTTPRSHGGMSVTGAAPMPGDLRVRVASARALCSAGLAQATSRARRISVSSEERRPMLPALLIVSRTGQGMAETSGESFPANFRD